MNDSQRIAYGVQESNHLQSPTEYHAAVDYDESLSLSEVAAAGGKITRLRILSEWRGTYGIKDVSYCHATLPNGKVVPVRVDGNLMGVPAQKFMGELIAWAKEQGVFAKSLGLLDKSNWSELKG